MKQGKLLKELERLLFEAGNDEAKAEAREILSHICGKPFSELILKLDEKCPEDVQEKAFAIARKRAGGVPLAYILNCKWFYGRPFYVDERVLIPRYDTECVVQRALKLAQGNGYQTVLDLCCGSGCIGITLAAEGSFKKITLSDIDGGALLVAKKNAATIISGGSPIFFTESDLFTGIGQRFDIVVSNPPYISGADYEKLDTEVKAYEPKRALFAEENGLSYYREIIKDAARHLNAGGALVLEIGDTQAAATSRLLEAAGFVNIICENDLAGRPRVLSAISKGMENNA